MINSRNIVISFIVVSACAFAYLIYIAFINPPVYEGYNLDSVDWLPPDASNVSFYRETKFGWIEEYICTIDEEAFIKLAKKKGWAVKPVVTDYRFTISKVTKKRVNFKIEHGYFYEDRKPNGGGKTALYDKLTQQLFYFASHR